MSHLQDMGDAAKYSYSPLPGEVYKHGYYQSSPSNTGIMLPLNSYDSQPDRYSQHSRVNSHRGVQQPVSGYGGGGLGGGGGFHHAPRQRTVIACRYCRRRKIKCSGFGDDIQGRCTNCQRFQQECSFVSVSSQAQAFVPAHLAFTRMQQFYDAHGQPLRQILPTVVDPPSSAAVSSTELCGSFADGRVEGGHKYRRKEPPPVLDSRRPAAKDNMQLPSVTLVAGPGLQQTPIYSPGPSVSSNSGLPKSLPPMSQFRTLSPKSHPSGRYHPTAFANMEPQMSEIDKNMLRRLDRKKY